MSSRGLYETLITPRLRALHHEIDEALRKASGLRPAEAADRIALHVNQVVRRVIDAVPEADRVVFGTRLVRNIMEQIGQLRPDTKSEDEVLVEPASVLQAIVSRLPDGQAEDISRPLIPLLDTTLLTNAPGEPRVGNQILAEIHSADRVDAVIAFIRRSGINPLLEALRRHCESGRELRVLTTIYTGSTEMEALDALSAAGANVRVSYDTSTTRLHAKAWLFHRRSGFSTAYIGSSNLTHSAQISGLEWNVRVSGARNTSVVDKVSAVFETYWNNQDFVKYDAGQFAEALERYQRPPDPLFISPVELRLEPFQERLVEQLELSRELGHNRNLLVSATGTGKTVMAAVDYSRLRRKLSRARLLFVAHRQEIIEKSLATFRHCLRDQSFGELWVGGHRARHFEHVFASIQSINAVGLGNLDPQHFDVVIVDEFHHAAAASYKELLDHVKPKQLLGLTATPERSDGLPILNWFDNRVAAELRLWDAIDQHRLSPFMYYGISDGTDLTQVTWRRGTGYDAEQLSNLFTGNERWARHVLVELTRHVDDVKRMRLLGFCVSVAHAQFMARIFCDANIPAIAIWADSPEAEREGALRRLEDGRISALFSVDLFNEGVDVPAVDTVLFLRPTDSSTLFLQQLGRGLRKSQNKTHCTVLDFVGHHRKEFRFDRRFRALLGGTRKQLENQIEEGFPFLPAGCHMELDRVAAESVLRNIRQAVATVWRDKVDELRALAQVEAQITLAKYLRETGLELDDVYSNNKAWSDLRTEAGLAPRPSDDIETSLRRACGRLLHVDDLVRIQAYQRMLSLQEPPSVASAAARERRLIRMLVSSVGNQVLDRETSLQEACNMLWRYPVIRAELLDLMDVLLGRVDHVQQPVATHPDVPLQVHARYSRLEILAAFNEGGEGRVPLWQTGVYWAEKERADLFAFTLDKTSGQFSPTTRYRDYAISEELIHWESQSVTRAEGETGRRYQNHKAEGSSVMLFARVHSDDRAFWFLGPATYVSHESELPMAVTWRLHHRLPGDLFASFAAAVA